MSRVERGNRRVRALRPPKQGVDPWAPLDVVFEQELTIHGTIAPAVTVFLAGAECPFTCVFCDLWRQTLDGPTPRGAVAAQLRLAARQIGERGLAPGAITLKLYNASNFFDRRAVPPEDDAEILELVAPFARVVVECHPAFIAERAERFARSLAGRLEVAIGLETVHPGAFARLGKGAALEDYAAALRRLRAAGARARAFVLVGVPRLAADEQVEWTARSVRWALERGADVVSLIPVRSGNGELERLAGLGLHTPPSLELAESCLERARSEAGSALDLWRGARPREPAERPVVQLDPWDLEPLAAAASGGGARLERLRRLNLTPLERVACLA